MTARTGLGIDEQSAANAATARANAAAEVVVEDPAAFRVDEAGGQRITQQGKKRETEG